jgi:hypothetical protein
MRWVAIGLSRARFSPRQQRLREKGQINGPSRGGQRRDDQSMEPAGGDTGTMNALSRGDEQSLAGDARFVCLGLDGRPVRTAGNEGVPLQ